MSVWPFSKSNVYRFLFVFFVFAFSVSATVITVPGDYLTIQGAIDASESGDEIIVDASTYYENINFNGKNIILRSTDPTNPEVVTQTIIDGGENGPVVTFSGEETEDSILSGFTITGGYTSNGGGIHGNGSFTTLENCKILNNVAAVYGGGIYNCSGTIQNCVISENSCNENGGGLYGCNGLIQSNLISKNQGFYGAGLYSCNGKIQNNIIVYNSTILHTETEWIMIGNPLYGPMPITVYLGADGGGLYQCNGKIINNTIYGNVSNFGGGGSHGASGGRGGGLADCSGQILNCIITGNSGYYGYSNYQQISFSSNISYCCIGNNEGDSELNIHEDPLMFNPEEGDFHLLSDSPCIDAGVEVVDYSSNDIDGDPRLIGSALDIGVDEFFQENLPPDKPINLFPQDGASNISEFVTLECSSFSDSNEGDFQIACCWQFGTDPDFTEPLIDTWKEFQNFTSFEIDYTILRPSTTYYWRVKHLDNRYMWSEWSNTTSFTLRDPVTLKVPQEFSTIQEAIENAFHFDEIIVSPGVYRENLKLKGMNITLCSTDPEDGEIVAGTIIDGSHEDTVVIFEGTETADCLFCGFTLTNGKSSRGGGIRGNGTKATIKNCIIKNNHGGYGGGIYNCGGIISNNIISNNSASYGGGLNYSYGKKENNIIYNNFASTNGGGLDQCGGEIINNIILEIRLIFMEEDVIMFLGTL